MPRGRRRKFRVSFNVRPDTIRSIISLIFVLLAVISLVSFFAPSYVVNSKIQEVLKLCFGKASILIPFLLAAAAVLFVDRIKPQFKELRIVAGLTIALVSLAGIFHIFISKEEAYDLAKIGGGGGIVGYKLSSILAAGLSKFGGAFVLFCLLVVSIVLMFNVSFENILQFFREENFVTGLLGKIGSLFHLKKGKKEESEVEVNVESVGGFEEEEVDDYETTKTEKRKQSVEPEQPPLFEVIQSMSEPQADMATNTVDSLALASPLELSRVPSDRIWNFPPESLLAEPPVRVWDTSDVDRRMKTIKETFKSFGVDVEIDPENVKVGSTVTQYAFRPKSVTNISKISSLQGNLALALASSTGSVRIEAPIPGKSLIGIEVPNTKRTLVYFKSLINSEAMKNMKSKLGVALGEDVAGRILTYDIGKMPHLLIAGTTGSGKSVFIHNILFSILFRATPQEVKFIIVDPKRVELIHYEGIPHLLTPVVVDMDKAPSVFRWAVDEVERRYKLFEQAKVRDIEGYNEKSGIQVMPYIVIVVDELGEIMVRDPSGIEKSIIRIAQLARATGIHLVLAVQNPSTEVITGLIKANIPCRVALKVINQVYSRVIIDQPGAEKLLGKGDMLFIPPDANKPVRLQGAYISDKEINDLVEYLKNQGMEPEYREEVLRTPTDAAKKAGKSNWGEDVEDDHFDEAVDIIITAGKASASLLQRKLSIGYARAARIIDIMEEKGIIGPEVSGSRGRDVLMDKIPDNAGGSASDPGFDAEDFTDKDFPRSEKY